MSNVDNYLKLVVREPQTEDDVKNRRLGRMVVHELFTFGPDDTDVENVRATLEGMAADHRERGNEASLSAFAPYYPQRNPRKLNLPQIGALDFARSKSHLSLAQLNNFTNSKQRS